MLSVRLQGVKRGKIQPTTTLKKSGRLREVVAHGSLTTRKMRFLDIYLDKYFLVIFFLHFNSLMLGKLDYVSE